MRCARRRVQLIVEHTPRAAAAVSCDPLDSSHVQESVQSCQTSQFKSPNACQSLDGTALPPDTTQALNAWWPGACCDAGSNTSGSGRRLSGCGRARCWGTLECAGSPSTKTPGGWTEAPPRCEMHTSRVVDNTRTVSKHNSVLLQSRPVIVFGTGS